jgi:Xaa-Pro aminopeptidase
MKRTNLLMVADSDHDANMLYATGMFVPDPFIFLDIKGRRYVVMSDLEIDRARKQILGCKILALSAYQKQLRANGSKNPETAEVIELILKQKKIKQVEVPQDFPLGLANELKKRRIGIKPRAGMFCSTREQKTPAEVKKISAALMMAEVGMAEAIQALKISRIAKDRRLLHHGVPLTSEKLRSIIDTAILQASGIAANTIVAGGRQGCDPHERGHGPLRAHELIVLDIFPRSQKTGYFGDITRTVVRGRASEAARKLYDTVHRGQMLAFKSMRAGVETSAVHKGVQDFFVSQGYKTGRKNGRMTGFFHGTGHGLGLEIHEPPRTGEFSTGKLKPGQVVTVEPGLYYPEIGGVRLEDVALVTRSAPRNLTKFEKVLEV